MSLGANLFFRALLNEVDDYGRLEADPAVLRATVLPLLVDQISIADVEGWLDELAHADDPGRHPDIEADLSPLAFYVVGRTRYLCMTRWEIHRGKSKRGGASKYPGPPDGTCDRERPQEPQGIRGDPRGPAESSGAPPEESRSRGVEEKKEMAPAGANLPPEAFFCLDLLNQSIEESVPGAATASTPAKREEAAREIDRLHRIGAPGTNHGWDWYDIVGVLEWLPTHVGSGDFRWGQQIRSAAALRKQFPRLHAAMQQGTPRGVRAERAQGALEQLQRRRAQPTSQRKATA